MVCPEFSGSVMSTLEYLFIMLLLVAASSFFSVSEIALAASRKMRLRLMATQGDVSAEKVLMLQEHPGNFFTVVQIGLNAVAILGGILGESAFTPYFSSILALFTDASWLPVAAFVLSVFFVTSLFILFADLINSILIRDSLIAFILCLAIRDIFCL